jgi:hypothetical protein
LQVDEAQWTSVTEIGLGMQEDDQHLSLTSAAGSVYEVAKDIYRLVRIHMYL